MGGRSMTETLGCNIPEVVPMSRVGQSFARPVLRGKGTPPSSYKGIFYEYVEVPPEKRIHPKIQLRVEQLEEYYNIDYGYAWKVDSFSRKTSAIPTDLPDAAETILQTIAPPTTVFVCRISVVDVGR